MSLPTLFERRIKMIDNLKAKNPDIEVVSVFDEKFSTFGRVITVDGSDELIAAAKTLEMPEKVIYTAAEKAFEGCRALKTLTDGFFGTLPAQVGYCYGHNVMLNATEWHTASEINIAVTPIILLLAHRWDIVDGKIDSSKFVAFYVPEGTAVEVYATSLHYTPCQVCDSGFGCIVVLPEGTNLPLDEATSDKLLTAKNKWLLAHVDNAAKIAQGAVAGITGKNYEIKY